MRIVLMGTPDIAAAVLNRLYEEGFEIAAAVTNPDRPRGRSCALMPSPVKELALRHGTEVLQPEKAGDPVFVERLRELSPDVIVAREKMQASKELFPLFNLSLMPHS